MVNHTPARYDFVLSRRTDKDDYALWRVQSNGDNLLQSIPLAPGAKFDRTHQIVSVGRYLLEWGPLTLKPYEPCFPYRLLEFDPTSTDPLGAEPVRRGIWLKKKFWAYRPDFGNPQGAHEGFDLGEQLILLPMGGFVLNVIPTEGRGTFQLWNFDPKSASDPLPAAYTSGTAQGSFDTIAYGHELIGLGNYVLDWVPGSGEYWLWSFDPQSVMPLAQPAIQHGSWSDIDATHQLVAIGDQVLDWIPQTGCYRLWSFDPKSDDPLIDPRKGQLPEGLGATTTLIGIQPLLPIDTARKDTPGTIEFMRDKIKHVVYLMLENRSFDHVCGWLYDKDDEINIVGKSGRFNGASLDMFNMDPGAKDGPQRVNLTKYKDGKLSEEWDLDFLPLDPYHDKTDVMRQYFYDQTEDYTEVTPGMGGFVWNNGVHEVMMTYSPDQLPVLNGLAREFAISDAWFCSIPSATDPNRAFAFTGSAQGQLNNFQNGYQYIYWPFAAHRASIWKVLWTNGFFDWKIYNSTVWLTFVHTYHLFLQGQIPSVDDAIKTDQSSFIQNIDEFKKAARAGKLPTFSLLEPVWIGASGTSSYHPGADPVVGERELNEIYEAMKSGPAWKETLFIITFDEHGGIYDHVPPPRAENPWPNDVNDGFRFDIMGVRVPTILVSPLIEKHTVFRSLDPATAYDSTSILATLLNWYGIPKARWCLGERTNHAPTFEGVFQRATPRCTAPSFTPPYDKCFPRNGEAAPASRLSNLDRLMAPRVVAALAFGKLSTREIEDVSRDIAGSNDAKAMYAKLQTLAKRLG